MKNSKINYQVHFFFFPKEARNDTCFFFRISFIEKKLEQQLYTSKEEVENDIILTFDNSLRVNAHDSLWYKQASHLKDCWLNRSNGQLSSKPGKVNLLPSLLFWNLVFFLNNFNVEKRISRRSFFLFAEWKLLVSFSKEYSDRTSKKSLNDLKINPSFFWSKQKKILSVLKLLLGRVCRISNFVHPGNKHFPLSRRSWTITTMHIFLGSWVSPPPRLASEYLDFAFPSHIFDYKLYWGINNCLDFILTMKKKL